MASPAERVLGMEAVAATGLYVVAQAQGSQTPAPRKLFVIFLAYALLGGVALIGPNAGDGAQAMGGLVLLAFLMPPRGQAISSSPVYKATQALHNAATAPPWPTHATTPRYTDPAQWLASVLKNVVNDVIPNFPGRGVIEDVGGFLAAHAPGPQFFSGG